ncbi:spindle and kinetochore-associated protein 1-like [Lineus longissimus]|uniref:spindle and kinetochore-associated protein 1-like n=1 Tax=Lineus longissimus TaxID=88925 RepID=UPI002B4C8210
MNSTTIEDLSGHFQAKIQHIHTLLQLRNVTKEKDLCELLSAVNHSVYDLEATVTRMKLILTSEREKLREFEAMKKSLLDLNARATYTNDNIPARLPKAQKVSSVQPASAPTHSITPLQPKQIQSSAPSNHTCRPTSVSQAAVPKQEETGPSIEYLTVDEFESVPKYMKGRMTYEKMNSAIDELNHAFDAKYKILRQRRSYLSEKQKQKARDYKAQENKDTKGLHFIVEDDIKNDSGLKLDKASKTLFTILRHCQRFREVRSGKLLRYVLCEYSY